MAFDDDESSQLDGAPVEGYEFIGSATTWRYTSHIEAATINGNAYTPLAGLRRGRIQRAGANDAPTLTVHLPSSTQLVGHYAFATPPRSLRLKLYRQQTVSGDFKTFWDGEVTSIVATGKTCEVKVPSALGARLATSVPTLTVQTHCQHFLYDARCRVARASFDHATTVASVSSDGRTVTVSGVGAVADQWFRAGEIVRDADGERRYIVDQVGAVLKINSAFRTLANPDAVTMYAGCDHTADTCYSKFSNLVNFGGFATIPRRNPWRVPLRLGDQ